jgi:peptidoglycan hydrolase-like protein with peptidoglycan-binding domain
MGTGSPDGIHGSETVAAVRAFQQANGVRSVGGWEAGHMTLLALDKALGRLDPTPPTPTTEEAPATVVSTESPGSKTDNGRVVQKPVPQLVPTSTTTVNPDADDDKLEGHVNINVGGASQWTTAKAEAPKVDRPHNKDLDPFCENGVMQLGSEIDVPWQFNRENRKFKLVSQFELDVDFAPTLCKKSPTLSVQVTVLKIDISRALELALNASMGLQNPPLGWFGQGAVELDIKPFRSAILKPLKLDIQLNGGGLIVPQESPSTISRPEPSVARVS